MPRDSGRRQDKIHHAGGDGASRHAVELRGSHFLSEGDAARGLDRLEAQRPIGCGSRQNNAERLAAPVCRQGAEKRVDRHVAATVWPGRGMKDSIGNAQIASRRNHVNMIGLDASLAFHFRDRHFACLGKQLRQMALVIRIEVLNQHECHAGIVRQMAEQLRECLQSAGGGSYANNDGERTAFGAFLDGGWSHRCAAQRRWRSSCSEPSSLADDGRVCFATRTTITFLAGDDRASSLARSATIPLHAGVTTRATVT